jgi:hypothetical protein
MFDRFLTRNLKFNYAPGGQVGCQTRLKKGQNQIHHINTGLKKFTIHIARINSQRFSPKIIP